MKTCAFITLGCKVNQYETQAIRESLLKKGFTEIPSEQPADVYVINTCTVTSVSDEKSRQYIKKFKRVRPDATLVVTGCFAEAEADALKQKEGIHFVITKAEEAQLADIITHTYKDSSLKDGNKIQNSIESLPSNYTANYPFSTEIPSEELSSSIYDLKISRFSGYTKAFLKIEDGCDMYCSYCIIPYVRGGIKSRKKHDIREEAERLIENGYKEIILTGIHLGAYGKDTKNHTSLLDVISMLIDLPGLERLRLSSIEVNEISGEIRDLAASSQKFCPHFHIPLQSGDNFILKRMNRKYSTTQFLETLDSIRSQIPEPSFTTDVMVGFPGEEEKHFENTLNVCKKAGFSRMHIFPFSVRNGTPAAQMVNRCPRGIMKHRKDRLKKVAEELAFAFKNRFLQKIAYVLVETEREAKTNMLCGYSERYMKVLFDGPDLLKNAIVPVKIVEITPSAVLGELLK